jgi:hypothetical protein
MVIENDAALMVGGGDQRDGHAVTVGNRVLDIGFLRDLGDGARIMLGRGFGRRRGDRILLGGLANRVPHFGEGEGLHLVAHRLVER